MYEIEHRALLTEESYRELTDKLAREAKVLGTDDKEVSYYIFPDKLLKVVRNISQSTAKLSQIEYPRRGFIVPGVRSPLPRGVV